MGPLLSLLISLVEHQPGSANFQTPRNISDDSALCLRLPSRARNLPKLAVLAAALLFASAAFAHVPGGAPEIVVQMGNTYALTQLAFSHDGRLLASSGFMENSVQLWDLSSGRQLRTFSVQAGAGKFGLGGVNALALSGNGQLVAAASGNEIDVWNVRDGEKLYRFPLQSSQLVLPSLSFPFAISENGRYLAWVANDHLEIRELSNRGQPVSAGASSSPALTPLSIAFTPDERGLAMVRQSGTGTTVDTLDLATGAIKSQKVTSTVDILPNHSIGFGTDGHLVVATREFETRATRDSGSGGKIQVHDLSTGAAISIDGPSEQMSLSPDGRFLVLQDRNELQLWDVANQRKILTSSNNSPGIINFGTSAIAFSEDGKDVAIGDNSGSIHVFDPSTGKERSTLAGHANPSSVLSFGPHGQRLYAGSKTRWDLKSGIGLRTIPGKISPHSVAADSGHLFAEDAGHGVVRIWDLQRQTTIATVRAPPGQATTSMAFSPDGSSIAILRGYDYSDPAVQQRQQEQNAERAKEIQKQLRKDPSQFMKLNAQLNYDPGNPALQVHIFDTQTGTEKFTLSLPSSYMKALAFSPNGASIAIAAGDVVKVWSAADGQLISTTSLSQGPSPFPNGVTPTTVMGLAFSPDGKSLAAATVSLKVSMDLAAQQQQAIAAMKSASHHHRFGGFGVPSIGLPGRRSSSPPPPAAVAGSTDDPQAESDGPVLVLDPAAGRVVATLAGHKNGAVAVAFSHDGSLLATSGRDGFIRIWDRTSGSVNAEIPTKDAAFSLAFSTNDRLLASTQGDGSVSLWDTKGGSLLATLVSLYDGADWLVATPDGLFDGSPAAWNQILWRYSRNTFDVAPVESYFNEYFYPGLLADIIAGRRPKAPQSIEQKDRRQPVVRIDFPNSGTALDQREIDLKLNVAEAGADSAHTTGSGAKDVRLFRNGSLVKVWHGDVLDGKSSTALDAKVRLVAGENRFTAYAFNRDNVKSLDAHCSLEGAAALRRQPVTYALAVGINKYANPEYYLKFAVADAQSLSDEIRRAQERTSSRVEVIPLYDDAATRSAILDSIRKIAAEVQPEDHVILFFASHGVAVDDRFYLIPHDLGYMGQVDQLDEAGVQEILHHSISDLDLEQALEGMDAGKIIVIIDACNSGQALEAAEKRRGPMNSRGLAQLAYEKGMYILTAAQSSQAALEVSQLGHGLLTYTLVTEGLDKRMSDDDPRDGKIVDREWLSYATRRVPEMQLETLEQFKAQGRSLGFGQRGVDGSEAATSQRPKVFYRRGLDVSSWIIDEPAEPAAATGTAANSGLR